ncbi:MAG: hypothetical protein RR855_10230 [Comamonas sp.]
MATPNYGYEKRQRELAKKKKKEDKLREKSQRKQSEGQPSSSDDPAAPAGEGDAQGDGVSSDSL